MSWVSPAKTRQTCVFEPYRHVRLGIALVVRVPAIRLAFAGAARPAPAGKSSARQAMRPEEPHRTQRARETTSVTRSLRTPPGRRRRR